MGVGYKCNESKGKRQRTKSRNKALDGLIGLQINLSAEACFCPVTKTPSGMSIVVLPDDSVPSSGTNGGLEGLDGDLVIIESRFEIERLTTGQRGGGERPCGSEGELE